MPAKLPTSRQRGQILPMMAILAVVLIAIIGLAIDVGRIMVAKAELVRAVDAAALAGVLQLPDMDAVESEVYQYMSENEPDATVEVPTSPAERRVEVIGHKSVDLTFMSVLTLLPGVGLDDPITVSADAVAGYGILPVDTYMDIDATGSMGASPCNQGQNNDGCPIKEAKDAAQGFADILLDDTPGASSTQVGVGPFRGCYLPPRTYQHCVPVGQMVADLTDNKGLVMAKIEDIMAQGGTGTNICLGMHKGEEILFGPNGQTASNTLKILVILSDGDNTYNDNSYGQGAPPEECRPSDPSDSDPYVGTSCMGYSLHEGWWTYYYYYQTRERELDIKTKEFADALKAQGVEIYVVGFGVCGDDDPDQLPTEEYCADIGEYEYDGDYAADRRLLKCIASSTEGTNDHYFEVPEAEDLPEVFGEIARQIAFRLIK